MIKILSLLAVLAFPAASYAEDASLIRFLGFSKDGSYAAFLQYGVQDGTGSAFAQVFFKDVAKNQDAAEAVDLIEDDMDPTGNEKLLVKQALAAAAPTLKKLGIVSGNRGERARLAGDKGTQAFQAAGKEYVLNLSTTEGLPPMVEPCYAVTDVQLAKLTLSQGSASAVLLDEKNPSDACHIAYWYFQTAYVYGSSVVVFLRHWTTGFEGPDTRYTMYSARL
jgi:predicted secreted protein